MAIEIDSHRYEIVIGTDTSGTFERNRAFVEMRALDTPGWDTLLVAFRSNATGKVTISMYQQDVPVEVLSYFLRVASEELSIDRWPLWDNSDAPR
jgi:hypothetical protein